MPPSPSTRRTRLQAAAVLGLLSGLTIHCSQQPPAQSSPSPVATDSPTPAATDSGHGVMDKPYKPITKSDPPSDKDPTKNNSTIRSKGCCAGKNECKGKGGCKSERNDCAGKNDCKGLGGPDTGSKECLLRITYLVGRNHYKVRAETR
jgi:hypothetical protein